MDEILVDWNEFRTTRTQLGAAFVLILGYFREDGIKSVAAIEEAMRARDADALCEGVRGDLIEGGERFLAHLMALERRDAEAGK